MRRGSKRRTFILITGYSSGVLWEEEDASLQMCQASSDSFQDDSGPTSARLALAFTRWFMAFGRLAQGESMSICSSAAAGDSQSYV
jgi:hypothetical protein